MCVCMVNLPGEPAAAAYCALQFRSSQLGTQSVAGVIWITSAGEGVNCAIVSPHVRQSIEWHPCLLWGNLVLCTFYLQREREARQDRRGGGSRGVWDHLQGEAIATRSRLFCNVYFSVSPFLVRNLSCMELNGG